MAENADNGYTAYPVFKGLQKPLEFLGIQGRYIYWAAGAAGGAIVGFIIGYCVLGFLAGLVVLVVAVGTGAGLIMVKTAQRASHQENRQRDIRLHLFKKDLKNETLRIDIVSCLVPCRMFGEHP